MLTRRKAVLLLTVWMVSLALSGCGHVWTRPQDTPAPTSAPTSVQPPTPTATWTPLPAAPLPTWTPAPTPTPIIYVIQKGDTLISVAKQFGVSAQFLQNVNGILDPRRLQIGQELLIPQEEPGSGPALPTPTPVPMTVENTAVFETGTGSFWLLGEVANPSGELVERVVVEAVLLDGSGQPVALEQGAAALMVIPPGESSAFAVLFRSVAGPFSTYRVRVLSADILQQTGHLYLDFAISSHEHREVVAGSWEVSGVAKNTGNAIAAPIVVVTAYDADGKVVAVRELPAEPPILGPGEQGEFSGILVSLGGPIARYKAQAQGERLEV